jgi:hypothetical protein
MGCWGDGEDMNPIPSDKLAEFANLGKPNRKLDLNTIDGIKAVRLLRKNGELIAQGKYLNLSTEYSQLSDYFKEIGIG